MERAIANLKKEQVLSFSRIASLSPDRLAALIRPSGYYRVKEKRLRAVVQFFLKHCDGDFSGFNSVPLDTLRQELLGIYGVGRETADSILLYALGRPIFVVDAYTVRMGCRHALFPEGADYDAIRTVFESSLDKNVPLFNEYHALIVRLGKEFCRPRPDCDNCPLNKSKYFHKR